MEKEIQQEMLGYDSCIISDALEKLGSTAETAGTLQGERDSLSEKALAAESFAADMLEAAAARVEAIAARAASA